MEEIKALLTQMDQEMKLTHEELRQEMKLTRGELRQDMKMMREESKPMFSALKEANEYTHAKLEALIMDVRNLQGEVESLKEHQQDLDLIGRIRKAITE
ncbi:hypothetical protein [Effusibacillus consociatus]|uniref:Uncharacterized protein n=1 Tax=Effusibacillus consociatus TaxID=1117041 RepID=A0ABV9Q7G8_9BACL